MRFTKGIAAKPKRERKVVVIGAGPAGLYAAGWLASDGYGVDVVDMLPEPGGLLVSGIPDLRLDKAEVRQAVAGLRALGVNFRLGVRVGEDISLDEVIRQYDAALVATGAWESRKLEVEGEELEGVLYALEYLVDCALARHGHDRRAPDLAGRSVVVVGGGLTAVDAVEVAKAGGAAQVAWFYRRTKEQAPAWAEDPETFERLAREVDFRPLTQPVRCIGEAGRLKAVEAIRMRLGELDSSGRPRPVPVEGSEFQQAADYLLVAAGEVPTPPRGAAECGIEVNQRAYVATDEVAVSSKVAVAASVTGLQEPVVAVPISRRQVVRARGASIPWATIKVDGKVRTTRKGVFAAGNVIDGPTQAGYASVEGMMAARSVKEYLETGEWPSTKGETEFDWRELMFD